MEAVLFVGLQAAGKSSFYRERFFQTHVRISMDLLRTRFRERTFLEACIGTQQPFVIDNTNPTCVDRERYLTPARARGYRTIAYYFDDPPAACLQRNAGRVVVDRVPDVAIRATAGKLEAPSRTEGFDQLFRVRIVDDRFEVREITNEL